MTAVLYVRTDERGSWNLGFSRRFDDKELMEVHNLYSALENQLLMKNMNTLQWKSEKNGIT